MEALTWSLSVVVSGHPELTNNGFSGCGCGSSRHLQESLGPPGQKSLGEGLE